MMLLIYYNALNCVSKFVASIIIYNYINLASSDLNQIIINLVFLLLIIFKYSLLNLVAY